MTAALTRLLLVENDRDLRDALVEQLAPSREFEVRACACGPEARAVLQEGRTDLVILDIGLPDVDRSDAVALVRQDGFRGPVILLTGQPAADGDGATPEPEPGGSDEVAKPFKFGILLERVRAQLRAHEASDETAFAIGPYAFKPGAKALVDEEGGRLKLTEKETAILRYLYRSAPEVVSREVLLQEVWGYAEGVTTHTLETHVYRLRQKIESNPSAARILVTEPGGYRLMA